MELELIKVELKKEITSAEERAKYLDVELKRITSKGKEIDSYSNLNDTNFNKLSEDVYLSRRLETYATWLLKGEMEKEKEYSYDLLTDKQRDKLEAPRRFIPKDEGNTNEQEEAQVEAQVERLKTNGIQYKSNNIKVTSALIKEDSGLGVVLREYQPLRELLGQELQKIKKGEATKTIANDKGELVPLNFKMVREHLGEVNADMLLSIAKLKGLECERPAPTKVYENKLDMVDYSNWKMIKKVIGHLWLKETPNKEDDIIIVADVNKALEALNLSALDRDIIKKYNKGYTEEDIAKELKINQSTVNRRIASITKRISEYLTKK